MIENIGLNALVFSPYFIAGEEINLYGYSVSGWFFLTDNQIHILINNRKAAQIAFNINTVKLRVSGHFPFRGLIIRHQRYILTDSIQVFRRTELQGSHIQIDIFIDPASATLLHPPPVLERVIDQRIGWNGRYRLIPIPDLYSVQRDFLDSTVGHSIGQLYPVADTQHIIGRELYPCHKSQNTVFEHQHQYSRRCAQACKQSHRGLIHQHRDYNNAADKEQQYLKNLHKPFHRTVLLLVPCIIYIQHHQQQAVDSEQYGSNDIHRTYFL